MWLGAHIGISDGLPEAATTGKRIGCEAIQIFSKSPQMWKGPPIADDAAAAFRTQVSSEGLKSTAVHHSYLINLASPKKSMLALSRRAFVDELQRAEKLGVDHLIFHPGAHMGEGPDAGLASIAESLNWAFEKTPGLHVRALLENAAGQGSSLCSSVGELAAVLGKVSDRSRVGVALDTCHLFASGVDFRSEEGYGALVDDLTATLGLAEVRAFHLNDAKADLGSHLDRHENIGRGNIGRDGFRRWLNDARWTGRPGFLETPLGDDGYTQYEADLRELRSLIVDVPSPTPSSRPGRKTRPQP